MDLLQQAWTHSMDYSGYRKLIEQLVQEGKTTGPVQDEHLINYSKLNHSRMKRLDKTTRLTPELLSAVHTVSSPQNWLVLTESWCGDAAQIIPILSAIAEQSDNIILRLILRDEHPEVMDNFLTYGGRSIPKLIIFEPESEKVLDTWGPRPQEAQEFRQSLMDQGVDKHEISAQLQKWYNTDKGKLTQAELTTLIHNI